MATAKVYGTKPKVSRYMHYGYFSVYTFLGDIMSPATGKIIISLTGNKHKHKHIYCALRVAGEMEIRPRSETGECRGGGHGDFALTMFAYCGLGVSNINKHFCGQLRSLFLIPILCCGNRKLYNMRSIFRSHRFFNPIMVSYSIHRPSSNKKFPCNQKLRKRTSILYNGKKDIVK